jgi:hypothetical protein
LSVQVHLHPRLARVCFGVPFRGNVGCHVTVSQGEACCTTTTISSTSADSTTTTSTIALYGHAAACTSPLTALQQHVIAGSSQGQIAGLRFRFSQIEMPLP